MKLTLRRALSFMMVLTMLLSYGAAYAAGSGSYPVAVHVDEINATIRLPQDAIYATRNSTVEDLFFQLMGEEYYDIFMGKKEILPEPLFVFDAIQSKYEWAVSIMTSRIYAKVIEPLELAEKYSYDIRQTVLDTFDNYLTKVEGVTVNNIFFYRANGHLFVVCEVNNKYWSFTMNKDKNRAIIIIVEEFLGSVQMNELRKVTMDIIDGIVFD